MRFCVLGPLEAHAGDRLVAVPGGRQRALLALLLVHAGRVVSRDRLIDELWRGEPPATASRTLDAYLSRLRRVLRNAGVEDVLITRAPGYALQARDTDAAEFEAAVQTGREAAAAGDQAGAATLLRDALALWRGVAYAEVADETWARPEAERLEELRLCAIEDRMDADLKLGRHAALVPELELLAARHRTRERLVGQLMLALYRAGRQADALAAYRTGREWLVEQLALEPGPELRRLEAAVLAQDAALDLLRDGRPEPPPVAAPEPRPAAAEGERKHVTVLFADVVGSMELAERTDPEEWRRIMQDVFAVLAAGVHRLEGTVDTFTGDGIMAVFGAPIAHEDHARRACYAALHLQHELASHATELRGRGVDLAVRIGLSSGEVVVGSIGDDLDTSHTAIGHTVGLAQRMEQLAEPGAVYLTEHTASLVDGFFTLRDLGEQTVKGVRRPVRVHELIGVGAARGALDVARYRGFSRFVGRARELRVLLDAVEQAVVGRGRLVGVVGEAGVGKSRLCHEFAELQRAGGIPVYRVAGQAHAKSVPLLPVLEFLRAYFEIGERDTDDTARERIASRVLALDERLGDELPLLFEFLGVADPDRPRERMDPEARQRRLLGLMKRLTRAQGAHEPIVTLIEDLHWLDPASEVFLANHVEAIQSTRAVTVLNFRPEYRANWMARSYYQQVALEPLGPDAACDMINELLGPDPSVAELADLIEERAQGNPFFIEELVRALVQDGTLDGERGDHRLARSPDETAVPATVQAVLAARIDRLGPRDKRVLQAAAVIGKEVAVPVLEQVAELDPGQLADAVAALIAGELVYEHDAHPESVLAFAHPLTREVAYRSQLGEHRRAVHANVARAIADHNPDRLDENAALVAEHWEAAGEALEASRWHARAAAWAGTNDLAQAMRHCGRVRELADALRPSAETVTLGLTARVHLLTYGFRLGLSDEEGETLFREAERMAEAAGDVRSQALILQMYGALKGAAQGDVRGYSQRARQALALAEEAGDAALYVSLVSAAAYGVMHTGDYGEALTICDRAMELAAGDATVGAGLIMGSPYAHIHVLKAAVLVELGDLDLAGRLTERGRELAQEQGDMEAVGWNHLASTRLLCLRGEPEAALGHARAALELAERIGSTYSRAQSHLWVGMAERARGDWRRAIEALERSAALAAEGHTAQDTHAERLALLGESYLGAGDLGRARALTEEALELAREHGSVYNELRAALALARVLLGAGARAEVEAALDRVLELASKTGAKSFEPLVHVERAELARQGGDSGSRERELREAHRLFTEIGATGRAEAIAAQLTPPSGISSAY